MNRSWRQHPTKQQLYDHQPLITKTIQIRRTRHAGHCWRSRDELISDVLLWTPSHGRAKAGRPTRTYIQQLCEDTGCIPEDLPEAMNDRDRWWERVRDNRADGTTGWLWWVLNSCNNKKYFKLCIQTLFFQIYFRFLILIKVFNFFFFLFFLFYCEYAFLFFFFFFFWKLHCESERYK